MNIFATDSSPTVCAHNLDDSRLRKMVTETAQLLSAVVREQLGDARADEYNLYKRPPSGQELVRWACSSPSAANWLAAHGLALVNECHYRFGKAPASERVALAARAAICVANIDKPYSPRPAFVNRCVNKSKGIDLRHIKDVERAYRLYLNTRWRNERPIWTKREAPEWMRS